MNGARLRVLIPHATALLAALALSIPLPAQLIQPGDFEYLGAFRLPGGEDPPRTFAYGGNAMDFRPDGDPASSDGFPGSLFVTGHDRLAYGALPDGSQVAEVSIPAPAIADAVEDLPVASFLQSFTDVTEGHFTNLEEIPKLGLAYLDHADTGPLLHLCWGQHLQLQNEPSHAWFSLDLDQAELAGPWFIGEQNLYSTTGYMFPIPAAWAAAHSNGRLLATGRMRDGGQGGMGPTLFAYQPWNTDGSAPAAGTRLEETTLLLYENAYTTDQIVRAMNGYQHPDEWEGGAWLHTPSGRSAVLFAGTKATGAKYWYGYIHPDGPGHPCVDAEVTDIVTCRLADGSPCPPEDMAGCCSEAAESCVSYRGWWSSRFDAQLILFDPDELARVAAGELESWQPQPYATLDIDDQLYLDPPVWDELSIGWGVQRRNRLGAAAFDPASSLLYVLELYADGGKPVVHVWRIDDTASPPQADFSFSPALPEVGELVSFRDTSTGTRSAWSWDFGDGGSSQAQNPSHSYAAAGSYTVGLAISGSAGSDQISRTLQVVPAQGDEPTPSDPGEYAVAVAAAAHATGLAGSSWVSDLELHAPGARPVTASLFFLPSGRNNTNAIPVSAVVPAGGALRLLDVVGDALAAGDAVGAILVGSDEPLLVSSRTYNNASSGSFGQYIPGVPLEAALSGTTEARLIQLTENADYRSNLGFVNLGAATLAIELELRRADGSVAASDEIELLPFSHLQMAADSLLDEDLDDAFAVVTSPDATARYLCYASVVDNLSNDPIFVQPLELP